jgi:sugar phosphate isomerase/epimerase
MCLHQTIAILRCEPTLSGDRKLLHLKLSVQLSTLGLPLKSALPVAAELGASAVEIDARQELPLPVSRTAVRQLLKWLDDYRLRISCLTFQIRHGLGDSANLERRVEAIKENLRLAYQLGCSSLVCDVGEIPPPEQAENRSVWLEVANELGRFAHKEGAFLTARTGVSAPKVLAEFLREANPGSLMVDLDPGNLILHGHAWDTATTELGAFIAHLHARDAVRDFSARRAVEVEVGRGSVDWAAILAGLEQHGFNGYTTIGRVGASNPKLEYQQAAEYLQNLF